jgi:hypothetical protein
MDANNNGDLTDDPVLRPRVTTRAAATSVRTAAFPVAVRYAGDRSRVFLARIELRGYRPRPSADTAWSGGAHLTQHLEGRLDFGGRKNVLAAIYDASTEDIESNACFNDYGADRLRIDRNGDGRLDPETEEGPLSRAVLFEGKLWDLETDAAAVNVKISPRRAPEGRLRFMGLFQEDPDMVRGSVELISREGYALRCDLFNGALIPLPPAAYRVPIGRLSLPDATGREWECEFKLAGLLVVNEEEETVFALGKPLVVEPLLEGEPIRGVDVCFAARFTGCGGEIYKNISTAKSRMKPELRVLDVENIAVLEAKMEYG